MERFELTSSLRYVETRTMISIDNNLSAPQRIHLLGYETKVRR
jgi:hypothetical protein